MNTAAAEDSRTALADLLARTGLGDRQAFAELYRRTSGSLFAVILRIQRDRAQAEELLQELYVSVWQGAGRFDAARAHPMTWLTQAARNRAIDSLRRAKARPQTETPMRDDGEAHGPGDDLPADGPTALELLDSAVEARRLDQCMHGLAPSQRQSLALAFFHGLSHGEVAEQLRQPLGTVKSWVRRGLLTLRACLDAAVAREAGGTPQHGR